MSKWIRRLIYVVVGLVLFVGIGMFAFNLGMGEIKNLQIGSIDVAAMADGTYSGEYSKGRWKYEVEVTVSDHKIQNITLINNNHTGSMADINAEIVNNVVTKQTLGIDVVGGASVNTKALLKAIENALTE